MMRSTITLFIMLVGLQLSVFAQDGGASAGHIYTWLDTQQIQQQINSISEVETRYPDSALFIYKSTFSESRKQKFTFGMANSLRGLGNVYAFKHNSVEAIRFYEQAIKVAEREERLWPMMPQLYNNIGTVYDNMAQYEWAVRAYTKALSYKGVVGEQSKVSEASIYFNLASTFYFLQQYEKAEHYLNIAEKMGISSKDQHLLGQIYNNHGSLMAQQNKLEKGLHYFQQSLAISDRSKIRNIAATLNIGVLYYKQGHYDLALPLLTSLLQRADSISLQERVTIFITLGAIYLDKKEYKKAEETWLTALKESEKNHLANNLVVINNNLFELYQTLGKTRLALQYHIDYMKLKDSFNNKEVIHKVHFLEARYRTVEKDKELAQQRLIILEQQSRIRTNYLWIWGSLLGFGILIIVIILIRRAGINQRRILQAKLVNQEQSETLLKQQKELDLLKAMMEGEEKERARIARELHDGIGGMLAAMKMNCSLEENVDIGGRIVKLQQMIEVTTDEVRKTAHNLMPDVLIRNGLEKALALYVEHISFEKGLEMDIVFQGTPFHLNKSSELIIYRIAQELIQNILKHAQASKASILIKHFKEKLSIIVEDNGRGFNMHDHANGLGLGLQNLTFRVNTLGGNVDLHSLPGRGTTIHIEFDIEQLRDKHN